MQAAGVGVVVVLSVASTARSEPIDHAPANAEPRRPPAHRLNLRAGLATSDEVQRPVVCLEVVAVWATSVEACGTGSGILHDEVGRQIAHFRLNVPFVRRGLLGGWAAVRGGAGFAELEVGEDHPGFRFGDPDPSARGSVAGPDAAISMQWLRPMGAGIELVATATAGLAWFASADELVEPQAHFQPYVSVEVGVGL